MTKSKSRAEHKLHLHLYAIQLVGAFVLHLAQIGVVLRMRNGINNRCGEYENIIRSIANKRRKTVVISKILNQFLFYLTKTKNVLYYTPKYLRFG